MKQFMTCLLLSGLLYLISSVGAADFNPTHWAGEGRFLFGLFIMVIWIIPILMNYLNGEENFENFRIKTPKLPTTTNTGLKKKTDIK